MKPQFSVRCLRPGERKALLAIGWRAFQPFFAALLSTSLTPHTLVAEDQTGQLVGGIVLRTFRCAGQKIGLVFWIFTDPAHHGMGVGKALLDEAIEWFRQEGCDQAVAAVDGYNSRSWNLFQGRGFRYWRVSEQWREFGWRWPAMLWGTVHLIDVGNFLLRLRLKAAQPEEQVRAYCHTLWAYCHTSLPVATLLLSLILWVAILRQGGWRAAQPAPLFIGCVLVVSLYTAVRVAGHVLAAWAMGMALEFRPWESGMILAAGLALAFGVFLPASGSFYVSEERFRYTEARRAMGAIALAGVIPSLVLFALFRAWGKLAGPIAWASLGTTVGFSLGLFDTVCFFSPFQAMLGGHLWRWSRAVWLAASVCYLGIANIRP